MKRYVLPLIFAVTGLSLAALIFIPRSYVSDREISSYPYETLSGVSILKASVNRAIWYAGIACAIGMLLTNVVCWRHKRRLCCAITLLIAVIPFPYAFLVRGAHSLGPWVVCDTVIGPEGNSYVFLESSFLQGQTLALGRILPDGLFHKRFAILGDTNGDSPRSYALLVRPTNNFKIGYGQLYLTDDNRVLGLRYDNRCYFAYDFRAKRFDGHGDIESLSPFTLVGPDSSLYRGDVESFLTHEYWPTVDSAEKLPFGQAILDARDHPNPEIREVARRMIARFDAG